MRILDPVLDAALTQLGASPEEKQTLVAYVVGAAQDVRNQVIGLHAQAQQSFNQAVLLEPQALAFEAMLEKFTNEIADPEAPIVE